jgi:hypothetical protein
MSEAALTIWISCGSLLVSVGSLVISVVAAYRRSDMLRRLDRLSELSRDSADLRPRLDHLERTILKAVQSRTPASEPGRGSADLRPRLDRLERTIPKAVQSRTPASEPNGDIADPRPRLDQLERKVPKAVPLRAPESSALDHGVRGGANAAAARGPRGQLDGAASIPKRVDNAGIETTSVSARQVSTRLEQLVQYMREKAGRPS